MNEDMRVAFYLGRVAQAVNPALGYRFSRPVFDNYVGWMTARSWSVTHKADDYIVWVKPPWFDLYKDMEN